MKKQIKLIEELVKMDPKLAQALQVTRAAGLHEQANTFARHLFTDTMIPTMGNRAAYEDFLTRHGNDGVHGSIDLNDFAQLNKVNSQTVGDQAIKAAGNIISKISRQTGGKSFHQSGDEFTTHHPTAEQAHAFARLLRTELEKHPKIGGTHNLAAAVGLGYNKLHAEKALLGAKGQLGPIDPQTGKRKNLHSPGNAPTTIHSLLHEPAPDQWKPSKGKPEPMAPVKHVEPGLTLHNPLKTV